MVLADRELRLQLNDAYNQLDEFVSHPSLGKYASILKSGHPFCVSKDFCILEYDLNSQVKKVNNVASQEQFDYLLEKLTGKSRFIFGLTRAETIRLSKLYSNLRQIGELPKPSTIKLEKPNK